jgi:hypothetical protein
VTNLYCDINMATLLAAPFSLSKGNPIIVRARAQNAIGWSTQYSAEGSGLTVVVQ